MLAAPQPPHPIARRNDRSPQRVSTRHTTYGEAVCVACLLCRLDPRRVTRPIEAYAHGSTLNLPTLSLSAKIAPPPPCVDSTHGLWRSILSLLLAVSTQRTTRHTRSRRMLTAPHSIYPRRRSTQKSQRNRVLTRRTARHTAHPSVRSRLHSQPNHAIARRKDRPTTVCRLDTRPKARLPESSARRVDSTFNTSHAPSKLMLTAPHPTYPRRRLTQKSQPNRVSTRHTT